MSSFVRAALDMRAEIRDRFEDYRMAEYVKAEEACRGAMLNERGRRAGVDPLSLFMGNASRAHAYASPELIEFWHYHGRPTFAAFEAQHVALLMPAW